ncbi:MAG: FAD-dependent oxidoreductase, partial [Bacteroidota bacterium]
NCAFALRRNGYVGEIVLYDSDPHLPYHRPPLSKAFLSGNASIDQHRLKSEVAYEKENIRLELGQKVVAIDPANQTIELENGEQQVYSQLVLATGGRPLIPPIEGVTGSSRVFVLRDATDAQQIQTFLAKSEPKRVLIIGGGYIGLEVAASLRKQGAEITLLEREERLLPRVTAPFVSAFFEEVHLQNGVQILCDQCVESIQESATEIEARCTDGKRFVADMIVLGVGLTLNTELAEAAGLKVADGILVDGTCQTSTANVYAIGDCTWHYNPHYDRHLRLESVQNATEQAKVAAKAICGGTPVYDSIPWFWSDQYDLKLQMVGLSEGYEEVIVRQEEKENQFSVWYFVGDRLLAVDAINHPKAYMLGTRFIKNRTLVDKTKLADPEVPFKPAELSLT